SVHENPTAMPFQSTLIALLILPFAGSAVAALVSSDKRKPTAWLSITVSLAAVVLVAMLYPAIADGGVIRYRLSWLPDLGLNFVLRMDGLAWLFAVLVTAIGALV